MNTPRRVLGTLCALLPALLLAACQSTPPGPEVSPLNVTIKLGRISAKTLVGQVDVPDSGAAGAAVGVGGGAWNGGGWSGGGVGFSVDLNQLLHPQPRPRMDLFQYTVMALDGSTGNVIVGGPAAPGLEPGACVRMVYPDGALEPRLVPSREC
ncbi:hypothetical protein OR16_37450 [Cupriavidus basilensis OR16]|uniref:Lipoprotein n=1 Tax=Cupriavidus basilensis OR16 TaxID=1127483 RepID=H1SGG5_9BURK|nr:hypothetical protein [Cupriavidus basilensis]EHP38395.1 hypothetical protein OR16_37450 [Cupriavidus basilensis OR16]